MMDSIVVAIYIIRAVPLKFNCLASGTLITSVKMKMSNTNIIQSSKMSFICAFYFSKFSSSVGLKLNVFWNMDSIHSYTYSDIVNLHPHLHINRSITRFITAWTYANKSITNIVSNPRAVNDSWSCHLFMPLSYLNLTGSYRPLA